ncbi:hypothetical protein KY290_036161 [Solanum tuberosum]|uniref:Uncharacterized protein n=1 Tax=Solanum tuberosum TaxID=4113 RepID=A0ABQ7TRW4_SOLTU|nr:hypothetical protein KY290_036161 [Solanum tuberosum]
MERSRILPRVDSANSFCYQLVYYDELYGGYIVRTPKRGSAAQRPRTQQNSFICSLEDLVVPAAEIVIGK